MRNYSDFEKWRKDAKSRNYRVRKVTVSNFNTYYQAISGPAIVGYFNTREGRKGRCPEGTMPGGNLRGGRDHGE